jgi:hypothetical protein
LIVALLDFLESGEEAGVGDRTAFNRGGTVVRRGLQVLCIQFQLIDKVADRFELCTGQNQTSD